ncbi:hypothetical protein OCU04_006089 [Sclerotinia nivalis]|uniref:Uncharacterized protein n=1 Tax=Sclerotinia nivalis TaxID=352851 RepID=A0A9X0DJ20_9HELO|nr:hypothetical protein OCU04_006089 [Sclerotinia nivalis]
MFHQASELAMRFLEQNSVDKLANEVKLEDTSSEEDSSNAVPVRSKSSKSFRASAKRASCKSAKSKTKGMRNIGDRIVKEEWIVLFSIFKTKKIGEVRKLVFAKRKISESVEFLDDDDEDIEPIGGGKPLAFKKSKKEKIKISVVLWYIEYYSGIKYGIIGEASKSICFFDEIKYANNR